MEFQTLFNTSLYCGYFTDSAWEFHGFLKAGQGRMDLLAVKYWHKEVQFSE